MKEKMIEWRGINRYICERVDEKRDKVMNKEVKLGA